MSNDRLSPKQYEAWLIQLLRQRFERANFKVEDHKKVGELPLEIDMIVISAGAEKPPNFAELPPLFHYFRQHNVMELKTEKDRLAKIFSDVMRTCSRMSSLLKTRRMKECPMNYKRSPIRCGGSPLS